LEEAIVGSRLVSVSEAQLDEGLTRDADAHGSSMDRPERTPEGSRVAYCANNQLLVRASTRGPLHAGEIGKRQATGRSV